MQYMTYQLLLDMWAEDPDSEMMEYVDTFPWQVNLDEGGQLVFDSPGQALEFASENLPLIEGEGLFFGVRVVECAPF